MDFKLEHAYPRIWLGTANRNSRQVHDTLEGYVKKRYYTGDSKDIPQYSGRKRCETDIQPMIIQCLRIKPMTATGLARELGKKRPNVVSAISRLRANNYDIMTVGKTYVLLNQLEGE